MNQAEILSTYESVSQLTAEMLCAARAADWDRLVQLEKNCAGLIERLRAGGGAAGDEAFRARKAQIIRKVLADDAEIRNLTQPWLAHLQSLLASNARSRNLSRAYGRGARG